MCEVGSKVMIQLVIHGCNANHHYKAIVTSIQNMMKWEWNVEICRCYREANRVVNRLANNALSLEDVQGGMQIYNEPHSCCREELADDLKGIYLPRMCIE